VGDATSLAPGYPIRTSSDPRSVDNSPRHNAASHVLHRPLMPRHPPCALTHLHTKNTRQKTSYKSQQFARCSQPLSNTQTPHPTTKTSEAPHPKTGVWSQSPTVCWRHPGIDHSTPHRRLLVVHPTRRHYSTRVPHGSPPPNAGMLSWCSLERR
jgi:hypothetical protein